jgi:hypothetical protein
MKPVRFELDGHRSVQQVSFDAAPLTVLFGKNNVGKTNVLEAIHILLSGESASIRTALSGRDTNISGGLWVDLEPGRRFDEEVAAATDLNTEQPGPHWVRLHSAGVEPGTPFGWRDLDEPETLEDALWEGTRGPRLPGPALHVLFLDWVFEDIHDRFVQAIESRASTERRHSRGDSPWLEACGPGLGEFTFKVPERVQTAADLLGNLASELLPDFVEGRITASLTTPVLWHRLPKVLLEFEERGAQQCADLIDLAGSGAARWMAAAVQIAIHLLTDDRSLTSVSDFERGGLSGHVFLLDEPEAHLHPSAVASVVRWCRRMVRLGATIVVASHHDEFLRTTGPDVALVHLTRPDVLDTKARTVGSQAQSLLQELAVDVGMHPATALSLHRAILFVEGPLDVAVLDEYGGARLDAAGILVVPVHGTKNLEGVVSGEVVTRLGLRVGILTDATVIATIHDRSNKRRSSEEKKVLRVLDIARENGCPEPTLFGVAEDDLLFAIPPSGIESVLGCPFPEWKDLVRQAREAIGASPSESVNWKQFALDRYGLDIVEPDGVRALVREVDLSGVPLPTIEQIITDLERWCPSLALSADDGPF